MEEIVGSEPEADSEPASCGDDKHRSCDDEYGFDDDDREEEKKEEDDEEEGDEDDDDEEDDEEEGSFEPSLDAAGEALRQRYLEKIAELETLRDALPHPDAEIPEDPENPLALPSEERLDQCVEHGRLSGKIAKYRKRIDAVEGVQRPQAQHWLKMSYKDVAEYELHQVAKSPHTQFLDLLIKNKHLDMAAPLLPILAGSHLRSLNMDHPPPRLLSHPGFLEMLTGTGLVHLTLDFCDQLPVEFGPALDACQKLQSISVSADFTSTAASDAVGQALARLSLKRICMTIHESRAGHSSAGLARILMCETPSVTLSGGGFDDAFFAAVKRTGELRRLEVDYGVSASTLFHVLDLPCLKQLSIGCVLQQAEVKQCGARLASPECTLEHLNISSRCQDPGYIARALLTNKHLRVLEVTHPRNERLSRYILVAVAQRAAKLQELSLGWKYNEIFCMSALRSALQSGNISRLKLYNTSVGLLQLCDAPAEMNHQSPLRLLFLSGVDFSSGNAMNDSSDSSEKDEDYDNSGHPRHLVSHWVSSMRSIPELTFSYVQGEPWLATAILEDNCVIESLTLQHSDGEMHTEYLTCLSRCEKLQRLNLSIEDFGSGGQGADEEGLSLRLARLQEIFSQMPMLRELRLADASIEYGTVADGEEDAGDGLSRDQKALQALIAQPNLKVLDISSVYITDEDYRTLTAALENNPSLEVLVAGFGTFDYAALCKHLWTRNTNLIAFGEERNLEEFEDWFEPSETIEMDPLMKRNKALRTQCRKALITLLAIRKHRRDESGLFGFIPKELVDSMAAYVWSTRSDMAWCPESMREYPASLEILAVEPSLRTRPKRRRKKKARRRKMKRLMKML